MGHRHVFFTPQLVDMENDRDWNHTHPDPRLHSESGSFIRPVENPAVIGVNTMACLNIPLRTNDIPLGNFSSEIPNYRAVNPRPPHDSCLHPSSAASSSQVPSYVQHGPPHYNQFTTGVIGSTINPQMDYGRAQFKRKSPALPMTFDSGNTSVYYSAGSSSSHHVSSDPLQPKPISGPQFWPTHPTNRGSNYVSNSLVISGEESQRNVRSRHNHTLHLVGTNLAGHHPPSNLHRHISPANISGSTGAGQWSHSQSSDSRRRIISSDASRFGHETNQSVAGSNISIGTEIDGGYHSTSISSRNPSTSSTAIRAPSTRGMGSGRVNHHGQRNTPYRAIPSYRPVGFVAEDGRRLGVEAAVPSRYSRPLSIIGRTNERSGRARNFNDRFHQSSVEDNARNRWAPEGIAMMNRLTIFDSRSFLDQHRDMRLDIDNMSYEELLALGERIGNVKMGLSEETVSKYLTEVIYSCQVEDEMEKGSCIICLEEYEDKESLGRLKCGHDFHFNCIKKWLQEKNACPICKASAVEGTMEE